MEQKSERTNLRNMVEFEDESIPKVHIHGIDYKSRESYRTYADLYDLVAAGYPISEDVMVGVYLEFLAEDSYLLRDLLIGIIKRYTRKEEKEDEIFEKTA